MRGGVEIQRFREREVLEERAQNVLQMDKKDEGAVDSVESGA